MVNISNLIIFTVLFIKTFAYFDYEIDRCLQTGGNKSLIDYSDLRIRKQNGVRKLFGTAVFHIPVDNTFEVEGFSYLKQGGEHRRLPFKIPKKKFCDFFFEDVFFYPEFQKVSDFPPPDYKYCPLANKTYHIRGYKPELKGLPKVMIYSGDYAIELVYWKESEEIFSGRCYVRLDNF